jgi:hypothetical protein
LRAGSKRPDRGPTSKHAPPAKVSGLGQVVQSCPSIRDARKNLPEGPGLCPPALNLLSTLPSCQQFGNAPELAFASCGRAGVPEIRIPSKLQQPRGLVLRGEAAHACAADRSASRRIAGQAAPDRTDELRGKMCRRYLHCSAAQMTKSIDCRASCASIGAILVIARRSPERMVSLDLGGDRHWRHLYGSDRV